MRQYDRWKNLKWNEFIWCLWDLYILSNLQRLIWTRYWLWWNDNSICIWCENIISKKIMRQWIKYGWAFSGALWIILFMIGFLELTILLGFRLFLCSIIFKTYFKWINQKLDDDPNQKRVFYIIFWNNWNFNSCEEVRWRIITNTKF